MLVDDDAETAAARRIMSKLDITSGAAGVRLSVNPEAKLRALIEITQNLRKSLAVDEVLPKLLDSLFKIFVQADRGFVVLRGPAEGQLMLKAVKQRRERPEDTIRISRTIINAGDGGQAGDPVGRRRQRLAVRNEPEHRRFSHPLDDVRPAGR